MSATGKYIIIALGLATLAYAGYYFLFASGSATTVSFDTNEAVMQNMLADSQLFIDRRQKLEAVSLDTSLFSDERFLSLDSFVEEVPNQGIGRNDPFAPIGNTN